MSENSAKLSYNSQIQPDMAPLESILRTEELRSRPCRPPDYKKENLALINLAEALADSPRTVLQRLTDTMLHVFRAGSTGVSLLTKDDGKRFYWPAISGKWKNHVGGGTPRDFGPCGDVLDHNTTLLFGDVSKRYTYFQPVVPAVKEALLVPFYVGGKAVGTIWAVSHDDHKFDAEDERLMKSLGKFASSAYQVLESLDTFKAQAEQARQVEHISGLLTAIIDSSDDAIISKTLDGVITSWNGSAERLFGYTAGEAVGQHISLIIPPDRLNEEATIIEQIRRGIKVDHFETVRFRKDGTPLDISLTVSPVKDASGHVIGASKIARDISDRTIIEADRQRFVTLADRCSEFIGMCDMESRPFYVNDAALKLVGMNSLEELRQVKVEDFFFPEDRGFIANEFIPKVMRDGSAETEVRFRNFKTGEAIWMIYNVFVIKDVSGNPIALGTFSQNITARKRTEQALRDSEERLRATADQLENQVFIRTAELLQRNDEIVQQSDQLRELSQRLLQTQDDERRRIARDLHDSAGQIVTALGIHLGSIAKHALKPKIRKTAEESQEMVQQLSAEIRTLSYLLHPPLLDETGLSDAIQWYLEGLGSRSSLKLELSIPKDFGRLPQEMEVTIFRVIQECLTNIHRHSGSKTGTIRLSRTVDHVSLEVQDNGNGMSVKRLAALQAQRSGVGIAGMRERVRHLNGALDIQSGSNGTTISVTFPMSAPVPK